MVQFVPKLYRKTSAAIDCFSCGNCCKEKQMEVVKENYSVCPIVFNAYEALKDKFESESIEFRNEFDEFGY